jgi:hypothetical protein
MNRRVQIGARAGGERSIAGRWRERLLLLLRGRAGERVDPSAPDSGRGSGTEKNQLAEPIASRPRRRRVFFDLP